MQAPNRPYLTHFHPFAEEQDDIEPAPSLRSTPQNERPTSRKSASSSGIQRTLPLHARATIVKTDELANVVYKTTKTKKTPRDDDVDVRPGFGDKLGPFMHSGVERNIEGVLIRPWNE